MELLEIVGWITQITTVAMFTTGIPVCWSMVKTKDARHVPYPFFLLGDIGNICFLVYGLMVNDSILISLNLIGAVLNTVYIFAYISVVSSKSHPIQMLIGGVIYICGLFYFLTYLSPPAVFAHRLGLATSLLNTVMLSTPLFLEIPQHLKEKSTEGMSMAMLIGTIACASSWTSYGLLVNDPFIYMPNVPAILGAVGKIGLLVVYGMPGSKTKAE
ncbi:sugar transporter SWEET1 [Lingula anatina]|uniref:Sugar transporter SWEET1 n=1 Tax=Lingula anatina TaxID=7574 RepID=A0A1S3KGK7_LINAN|nr:sugar transporter SWEET1 [Lingula anatina]|eukprot:XP_013421622.1 sugar transporter SWEET1 [Lingula anatina]